MLDPKHLYWLSEIVDLGSFSHAAQKLNVTQPTLSRAVQVIESQVGSRVLERKRYGVRPIGIGIRLSEAGRNIAAFRVDAENAVDLWRGGLHREVRIGVGPMLAASFMGGFFSCMLKEKTKYAMRVVSATASWLIDQLNEGNLEIVLAPEQINHFQDDLVQHKIFEEQLAIFAGPGNSIGKSREIVEPSELQGQEWIAIGALSGIFGSSKEIFANIGLKGVTAKISFTGDILMAAEILQRTNTLCIMPQKLGQLSPILKNTHLVRVSMELPRRDIVIWCRRNDQFRPEIQYFHNRLQTYLAAEIPDFP